MGMVCHEDVPIFVFATAAYCNRRHFCYSRHRPPLLCPSGETLMRYVFGGLFAGLAAVALSAGPLAASDVEVKGAHICCPQCVKIVGKILAKVDGVSEVKADATTKTVTFAAKDAAAAKAGFKALVD